MPDDQNQYRLTLLKKLSQSTKPPKVKESIADFTILSELYEELDIIISKLGLSYEGIRYYAGSMTRSWMFQLQRREANDRHIHAAAFIGTYFSAFRLLIQNRFSTHWMLRYFSSIRKQIQPPAITHT